MKNMNLLRPRSLALLLMSALLVLSVPALAKNNKHGKGGEEHGKGRDKHRVEDDRHHSRDHDGHFIVESNRSLLLNYLEEGRHCPPGLAKKHNGCLPPGQAKKYYRGMVVEPGVVWVPLPEHILVRLAPPPPGAVYVQVDRNVLLVTEATRKILDAVTLLSAVR